MDDKNNTREVQTEITIADKNNIRELQNDIITLRIEGPTIYANLLKKQVKSFVAGWKFPLCEMPENLKNVCIEEPYQYQIPAKASKTEDVISVEELIQQADVTLECCKRLTFK